MNEEGIPILPLIIGSLILCYFGLEVNRQRNKLRSIFNVFDREESEIAAALEKWVESGELKPYVPSPEPGSVANSARPSFPSTPCPRVSHADRLRNQTPHLPVLRPVGVRWDRQTLQVRDEEVFGSGKAELCARFLHRVFAIQEVQQRPDRSAPLHGGDPLSAGQARHGRAAPAAGRRDPRDGGRGRRRGCRRS